MFWPFELRKAIAQRIWFWRMRRRIRRHFNDKRRKGQ